MERNEYIRLRKFKKYDMKQLYFGTLSLIYY